MLFPNKRESPEPKARDFLVSGRMCTELLLTSSAEQVVRLASVHVELTLLLEFLDDPSGLGTKCIDWLTTPLCTSHFPSKSGKVNEHRPQEKPVEVTTELPSVRALHAKSFQDEMSRYKYYYTKLFHICQ